MPWPLYLALKQLFPSGQRFGSVIFWIAVTGVLLGVTILVVVQSVMGGFGAAFQQRMVETFGHLDVGQAGRPFVLTEDVRAELEALPGIESVVRYAYGVSMVRYRGRAEYPLLYGLEVGRPGGFPLESFMAQGVADDLDDERVILNVRLASLLRVVPEREVELFTPLMLEAALDGEEVLLPHPLEVSGLYSVDSEQAFVPGAFLTLRALQSFYGLGEAVHGLTIRVGPEAEGDLGAAVEALQAALGPSFVVTTWRERWADFLWVLELEKNVMFLILLLILLVAAFAIAVALIINVLRKTKEIGLLGALGARASEVLQLYLWQGLLSGLLGTALGLGLAALLLSLRDQLILGIAHWTGTAATLERFYYFAHLPIEVSPARIALVVVFALILSTLAGLIPAISAARKPPAHALRVEA